MKGIVNITELALLYFDKVNPDLYKDANEKQRVSARVHFRKLDSYDKAALKKAKAEYLKIVKAELDKISKEGGKQN